MRYFLFAFVSIAWCQSPGSMYVSNGKLADSFRDVRAAQVDDIVTIVVLESLTAVSSGATNTSRASAAQTQITAAMGILGKASKFANPLNMASSQTLAGTGQTSRNTTLTTTISAKVIQVTANGNLVVEATKEIMVNSEKQTITVRGMVRPADLTPANVVASNQVADLSVKVTGKGAVADAIRRPNILYRFLLGLLPF
jgi:flagellar L-ring protein precursor FlgH